LGKIIRHLGAPVAQWIERWTSNPKVGGSNPSGRVFALLSLNIINEYYQEVRPKGGKNNLTLLV
jgi:hypothetical protein